MTLTKKEYESFGLHMIGGNKTGIFIECVDNWKPAQLCGIQEGWRILKVF